MEETLLHSINQRIMEWIRNSKTAIPSTLAMIVGMLAGFGAIAFRYLIDAAHHLFFDGGEQLSEKLSFLHLGRGYIIFVPAVGLLMVTWIVQRWAIEAKGHGVPEVQYAIKKEGGVIRPRVAFVKVLASALCIGSGGSVGREGPIVQIGCSLGSTVGRVARLRESDLKILVACGAAAGIGATFNAPIAGVMFALEVILGSFAARSFGLVVISSVTAVAVSHAFLGKQPAFELIQPFTLNSHWELPLYIVLGFFTGAIALVYVRSVYYFEYLFERWKQNIYIKALLGGLALGALGYFGSEFIFGVGYEAVELALRSNFSIQFLLILLLLKIVATSLTLGAGGSGGVFAPALFIGAMAGSAFGLAVNQLFPIITAPAGAYVLVGMAALFAGAAHAPITSVLILFEMTDDYKIILPLMLSVVVSHLVATKFSPDSIYSIKLRRRGGLTPDETEASILDTILVADAMFMDYQTVPPELPVIEMAKIFHERPVRSCPVIDSKNSLVGIVTEFDVEKALVNNNLGGALVSDIMTTNLITCTANETFRHVLNRFTEQDIHQILVVDKDDPKKLSGVLRRSEIFWAYNILIDEQQRILAETGARLPTDYKDSVQMRVQVDPQHSKLCFKKIRDIEVPDQSLIVTLRRANRAVIPRGDTVIEPGDVLMFLTTPSNERKLRSWIRNL